MFKSTTIVGSQNSNVQGEGDRKVNTLYVFNFFSWIAAESIDEAAHLLNLSTPEIEQDSDVLDTWFSSALIPLTVTGDWPANKNLKFPLLDVMQTGHDIIGFWIARMMTMSYK